MISITSIFVIIFSLIMWAAWVLNVSIEYPERILVAAIVSLVVGVILVIISKVTDEFY